MTICPTCGIIHWIIAPDHIVCARCGYETFEYGGYYDLVADDEEKEF